MELLLNRYRNLAVLVVAIVAQLFLLAYQIRGDQEVRLIRVWAVSAVTPLAKLLESVRGGAAGLFRDYVALLDVREENRRLKEQLGRMQLENQQLRTDLYTAGRAEALALFQSTTPMKTVAARVIANTAGSGSTVIVDRGETHGVRKGMAVITPSGIVGKVTAVFPAASFVLLATDPAFAAGVVSQKHRVHGTVKGQGDGTLMVDYVQNEQVVEPGEQFFTDGEDLVFPRGRPVGVVSAVREGRRRKEIYLTPSGFGNGLEEVLIVTEGVHEPIPEVPAQAPPVILPPPPPENGQRSAAPAQSGPLSTEADHVRELYLGITQAQGAVLGERGKGAPDFNIRPTPPQPPPAQPEPPRP
jgi:rod shape-determining protein MreC